MAGGTGNDLYIVDDSGDVSFEADGEGTDTEESSVDRTLAQNLENLHLTGAAAMGFGNLPDNMITGNDFANVLSGDAGNDTIYGAVGIDTGQLKLSGTVGYQLSDKGQIVGPIRLVGSPDGSDPAMIRTLTDKQMLLLGANVEVKASGKAALQFGVKGLYGDRVKSETADVKLVVRF